MSKGAGLLRSSGAWAGLLGFRTNEPEWHHPLLLDLRELPLKEGRELACALSMLWDEHQAGDSLQGAAYIVHSRQAAHRVRQAGGPHKAHYALALELMALWVEIRMKHKPSPQEEELADAVKQHASRGALIRRAGARTQH